MLLYRAPHIALPGEYPSLPSNKLVWQGHTFIQSSTFYLPLDSEDWSGDVWDIKSKPPVRVTFGKSAILPSTINYLEESDGAAPPVFPIGSRRISQYEFHNLYEFFNKAFSAILEGGSEGRQRKYNQLKEIIQNLSPKNISELKRYIFSRFWFIADGGLYICQNDKVSDIIRKESLRVTYLILSRLGLEPSVTIDRQIIPVTKQPNYEPSLKAA